MGRAAEDLAWRWKLVLEYERVGNYSKVAQRLLCDARVVKKWVLRDKETGDVQDKDRSGRPSAGLSRPEVQELLKAGIEDGLKCPQLSNKLKKDMGISVSKETVRLHLHANLGRPLRPRKKPQLTDSHKAKRLAFCLQWVNRDWSNVAVSDSKIFWLSRKGIGNKVWVLYGAEPPVEAAYRDCTKVHAYAAVTRWGKTPLFFTAGTTGIKFPSKGVGAQLYLQLLEQQLVPAIRELMKQCNGVQRGRPWIFQQDGAPAHRAKVTKAWLAQQPGFTVMEWPPNSPDLSWIENLWSVVAKQLHKRTDLTPQNFAQAVIEEWDRIPSNTYMALYNSIQRRLRSCIENNGGHTKY